MKPRLLHAIGAALLCAWAVPAPVVAATAACAATAKRVTGDSRIGLAVDEARRQHELFGGQTIERNGGMFRVGQHEAEWSRGAGDPAATWERVAKFWRSLAESEPPSLMTSTGRIARSDVTRDPAFAGNALTRSETAVREALLRAAIVDTPWSAAFISYLMKASGFSPVEFAFSDSHSDYVRAALETSAAEAAGREAPHAFRACDLATTRPRAGDLICATRASTTGTAKFDALPAAMAARSGGQAFPMHCDLVVRSDEGGDAKLESIGGNVVNSVTLRRMTLNARKVLGAQYVTGAAPGGKCTRGGRSCRDHLSRRTWLVLLQFRH